MKYCMECKYYVVDPITNRSRFAKCSHPNTRQISLVTGEPQDVEDAYCSVLRRYGKFLSKLFGACGEDAKWFEEKKHD